MNNKKVVKKYHLKDNVKDKIKSILIIFTIYLLFVGYLLFLSNRIEDLDNKQNTIETAKKNK